MSGIYQIVHAGSCGTSLAWRWAFELLEDLDNLRVLVRALVFSVIFLIVGRAFPPIQSLLPFASTRVLPSTGTEHPHLAESTKPPKLGDFARFRIDQNCQRAHQRASAEKILSENA